MQIGEVAQRTGLSQRSLRYYEEIDLVVPSERTPSGYRVYTAEDVDRLLFIKRFKPLGFSLEETRDVMAVLDALATGPTASERADLHARLALYEAEARKRAERARQQLALAEELAADLASALDHRPG